MSRKISMIFFVFLFVLSCENNVKSKVEKEYVVLPSVNSNHVGFDIINIKNDKTSKVDAVKQLNGNIYLPIFSSLPGYNRKVVDGYFVQDTNYYQDISGNIFVVTCHLRDTTIGY